jgi:hypothetical protein
VTRGEQFVDDGGADPSGGSGDEYVHVISFGAPPRTALAIPGSKVSRLGELVSLTDVGD